MKPETNRALDRVTTRGDKILKYQELILLKMVSSN